MECLFPITDKQRNRSEKPQNIDIEKKYEWSVEGNWRGMLRF